MSELPKDREERNTRAIVRLNSTLLRVLAQVKNKDRKMEIAFYKFSDNVDEALDLMREREEKYGRP